MKAGATRQTVYLAGPIFNQPDVRCKDWRKHAGLRLIDGFEVLDPMRRDFRGREQHNAAAIVYGDKEDIDRSDIVLAMATRPSWGTAMEIYRAHEAGKMVVAVCGESMSPWLRLHTSHQVTRGGLDAAIEFVRLGLCR